MEELKRRNARKRKRGNLLKLLAALMGTTLLLALGILILGVAFANKTSEVEAAPEEWRPNIVEVPRGWEDREPPVIAGVQELTVIQGGSVAYKREITVTDNRDDEIEVEVNTEGVDLNTLGDYPITYRAIDRAGNEVQVSTVLHVVEASQDSATELAVDEAADQLLAQLLTADMSDYDKAQVIYNWVHEEIAYVDGTAKDDWVTGAYQGLVEHRGDCYTYASTAQCLLTKAGIDNMMIEKIPSEVSHYWNLINLGEGWYHFDATRRSDGSVFFYVTDQELMEYSQAHNGSHGYRPEDYPQIQ